MPDIELSSEEKYHFEEFSINQSLKNCPDFYIKTCNKCPDLLHYVLYHIISKINQNERYCNWLNINSNEYKVFAQGGKRDPDHLCYVNKLKFLFNKDKDVMCIYYNTPKVRFILELYKKSSGNVYGTYEEFDKIYF